MSSVALVLATADCAVAETAEIGRQTGFRVRGVFDAPLNAVSGWAGAIDEAATVAVDEPFRLRLEIERSDATIDPGAFRLQARRNRGPWAFVPAEDFPKPEEASPQVSIVSASGYEPGEPTTDLLAGSDAPFCGGAGVSLATAIPARDTDAGQSEWEWPLVLRRFADGAVTTETGDRFEFRMVDQSGEPIASAAVATVIASVPPRHLGGTFVETPGRVGPWEASTGDLYFVMEPAETDNLLMMVKSTDGGATWREVDGANRPKADDLEGVASVLHGDTVQVLHQTSDEVWRHAFRTSDHPRHPDTWAVRDELVAAPAEPPTQVAAIAARSDGSLVALYGGPSRVHLKVRSTEGVWGEEVVVDADTPPNLSGPQLVLGARDSVHIAYTGSDGTAWHRVLEADGQLTPRVRLAVGLGTTEYDVGSILPLVHLAATDTVVVIYRLADGYLWERRSTAGGPFGEAAPVSDRPVVQNAVDSDQTGADAIAVGDTVHVLFIDEGSRDVYHTSATSDSAWNASRLAVGDINAQWLRGAPLRRGSTPAIGFVYDAGSDGGSGRNRFDKIAAPAPSGRAID